MMFDGYIQVFNLTLALGMPWPSWFNDHIMAFQKLLDKSSYKLFAVVAFEIFLPTKNLFVSKSPVLIFMPVPYFPNIHVTFFNENQI